MTQQVDCTEAVAALLGVVEKGGSMTDEKREHLRTCERCRELLDSAREFQNALSEETPAPEVHHDAAALEREVAAKRRRNNLARIIIAVFAVAMFFFLALVARNKWQLPEPIGVFLAAVMIAGIIALPVMLLVSAIRGVTVRKDGRRAYRRLGSGRQVAGVCVGLSETFAIRAEVLRLMFIIAAFFKGFGLLVYILFALVMPVHPDDRQYMLRFRLRRAFGGDR